LHVLSTPPAFVLSQDQTLHKSFYGKADLALLCCFEINDLVHLCFQRCDPHIHLVSCYSVFKVPAVAFLATSK
jgi:hypothetical protein